MTRKTVKIGLIAGPGCGKTTLAASVFSHYKQKNVNIYYVPEFAREEIDRGWKPKSIAEQFRIIKEQRLREDSIPDQVKVMVTDSPVFLCYLYALRNCRNYIEDRRTLVSLYDEFLADVNRYDHLFFVNSVKPYVSDGCRTQSWTESIEISVEIKCLLDLHKIPYSVINGDESGVHEIIKVVNNEVG